MWKSCLWVNLLLAEQNWDQEYPHIVNPTHTKCVLANHSTINFWTETFLSVACSPVEKKKCFWGISYAFSCFFFNTCVSSSSSHITDLLFFFFNICLCFTERKKKKQSTRTKDEDEDKNNNMYTNYTHSSVSLSLRFTPCAVVRTVFSIIRHENIKYIKISCAHANVSNGSFNLNNNNKNFTWIGDSFWTRLHMEIEKDIVTLSSDILVIWLGKIVCFGLNSTMIERNFSRIRLWLTVSAICCLTVNLSHNTNDFSQKKNLLYTILNSQNFFFFVLLLPSEHFVHIHKLFSLSRFLFFFAYW